MLGTLHELSGVNRISLSIDANRQKCQNPGSIYRYNTLRKFDWLQTDRKSPSAIQNDYFEILFFCVSLSFVEFKIFIYCGGVIIQSSVYS